jgi:hypothetical protein
MKSHLSEVSDPCKDAVRPQLAKADKFEERSLDHNYCDLSEFILGVTCRCGNPDGMIRRTDT